MSYEERALRFRELATEGQALKDKDPVKALGMLREAESLFPDVEGLGQWIKYLEAKIRRQEAKARAAEKAAKEAAEREAIEAAAAAEAKAAQEAAEAEARAAAERAAAEAAAEQAAREAAEREAAERAAAQAAAEQAAEQAAREAAEKAAAEQAAAEKAAEQAAAAPVVLDQSKIKAWVRDAEGAAKSGDIDGALGYFDQALGMLRAVDGPIKVHLKLVERRNQIQADTEHLFEAALLYRELGENDRASKRAEATLRKDSHHLGAAELKVQMAKEAGQNHSLLSALMQLSDAYDKHGKFQEFDQLQKEIRALRDSM